MIIYRVPLDFTLIRKDSLDRYLRHLGIHAIDKKPLHLCSKTELLETFAGYFYGPVETLRNNPGLGYMKLPQALN